MVRAFPSRRGGTLGSTYRGAYGAFLGERDGLVGAVRWPPWGTAMALHVAHKVLWGSASCARENTMHILRGACIPIPILRYLARKGISGGTWRNCCSGDLALMGHDDGFACGFLDPLAVECLQKYTPWTCPNQL